MAISVKYLSRQPAGPDCGVAVRARRKRKNETTHGDIRKTVRWRKTRLAALAQHPMCVDPFERHSTVGRFEPAVEVHHILPLSARPDLALDLSNLAPVCTACHGGLNSIEHHGGSTEKLFGPKKRCENSWPRF